MTNHDTSTPPYADEVATGPLALTVFRARAGDHNDLGMPGAEAIGQELAQRLGTEANVIGEPEPALNLGWERELTAARPALTAMAAAYEQLFREGLAPVTALSRCVVSLATLPVVARHRPDACVVWFDSHADLNTPGNTTSGYLGGLALSGPVGLWDSGFGSGLALSDIVLGGARDLDPPERKLVDEGQVALAAPGENLLADLRAAVAGRPVYFHLDCDVLEPGIVPTDYVVPGGLTLHDLHAVSSVLAESEVIGIEIGEFQATWHPGGEPVTPGPLLDALHPLIEDLRTSARTPS